MTGAWRPIFGMCERIKASCFPAFRLCPAWGAGPRAGNPRSEGRFAPMKRKGAPAKGGKCPRDAPKDQKCDNCRLRKGACQFAARIAAGHALPSPDEPSTSKLRPTQPVADSDMDIDPPNTRPSRQCQPPERFECDEVRPSRATGQRISKSTCCSCSEPTTSDEPAAPKPKFTGPMDKYLSDKRVEAAVKTVP